MMMILLVFMYKFVSNTQKMDNTANFKVLYVCVGNFGMVMIRYDCQLQKFTKVLSTGLWVEIRSWYMCVCICVFVCAFVRKKALLSL